MGIVDEIGIQSNGKQKKQGIINASVRSVSRNQVENG